MKHKYILFLLSVFYSCFFATQAQTKRATIIDDLEALVQGEGVIHIDCDPSITDLIGSFSNGLSESDGGGATTKMTGFRIQVFMSNNAKTAKQELSNKGSMIKSAFPEISVYSIYSAPNFKLLAGDFLTREEANAFKQKMQKTIPALGKEMVIVQDKVSISVQKYY